MYRLFLCWLCLILGLGNALPAQAIYHCSMTGQRTWMRCCCAPASAAVDSSMSTCSHCERADKHPGQPRSRPVPSLTRPCCKVSYERGTPKTLPSSASLDSGWKRALSDARLIVAVLPLLLPRLDSASLECFPRGTESSAER